MKVTRTLVSGAMLWSLSIVGADVQVADAELAQKRDEMLVRYSDFKKLGIRDPQQVFAGLSPDRQAQFDAGLRALFLPLEDKSANKTKQRPIDFLEAVHGIWGVRPGNREGKHQFRLSVQWKPGLSKALHDSGNMPESSNGHVIMAVQSGGDDDPTFTAFDVRTSGVTTHRQASREPRMQISYFEGNQTVGELDIDFDQLVVLCTCHCKPSNSDVGSVKNASHRHLDDFNASYDFFSNPLRPSWTDATHHCERSY